MVKGKIEIKVEQIITNQIIALDRPDLFREPIVAFSAADDKRYGELKEIIGEWHLNPTELLSEAKSVISYFVPFTKEVASEPKKVEGGSPLWSEAYQEINEHFDNINQAVSDYLNGLGYSTKTIKATHTYDPKDMRSMWSHRSAAAIAGLGSFGANKLLITEKGSGGRFCTILTSAILEADQNSIENKCHYLKNGSCGLCFKICPVNALSPDSIDKFVCQDEVNKNEAKLKETTKLQSADTCGKCISVCPFAHIV